MFVCQSYLTGFFLALRHELFSSFFGPHFFLDPFLILQGFFVAGTQPEGFFDLPESFLKIVLSSGSITRLARAHPLATYILAAPFAKLLAIVRYSRAIYGLLYLRY